MNPPLIDHSHASDYLSQVDSDWQRLVDHVGECRLTLHGYREPYEALVRAVAYQQLHGRAAEAILGRLLALFPDKPFPSPEDLLTLGDEAMRACGFSATKTRTIRGIAAGTLDGTVPLSVEAMLLNDDELIARLVTLKGIGRWTVEMLLIFTLGRMDILPVDDFGVREGWRLLKELDAQPKPKAFAETGLAWSPYRSVAAWYLWQAAAICKTGAIGKKATV